MTIRAEHDPRYFRRFLYIAIGCIAFSLWFFYDGLIGYPAELERSEVYWTPVDEPGRKYEPMEREEWRAVVKENGWPTAAPRPPDKVKNAIQGQFFYGSFCAIIAIPCLLKWWLARGSWVEGTETEVKTSWRPGFAYKDITSIDKTKWGNKGITRIYYEDAGQTRKFAFDDFKFERKKMGEILELIEQSLQDDQIEGGERQSVLRERREAEKAASVESQDESEASAAG